MNFVAWQMLTGDRAKYAGLVLAIAFSTFLMSHQMSIFVGLLNRTQSQIIDIADAEIWVMDPKTEYLDEVRALSSQDLYRVRGVEGIQWAVPLFKGNARAKASDGQFRNTILLGLDDTTLVGLPRIFLQAIIVLCIGYALGISMTAAFFEFTKDNLELRGFRLLPEIMLLTGALATMVVLIATMISVRRVAVVEPAIVFRG